MSAAASAAGGAGKAASGAHLRHFAYEVRGKVQGVFFRKHTSMKAVELGIRGWVANHADGVRVVGEAEGPVAAVSSFRHWLAHTGSPKSVIEGAAFSDERDIADFSFRDFSVRK